MEIRTHDPELAKALDAGSAALARNGRPRSLVRRLDRRVLAGMGALLLVLMTAVSGAVVMALVMMGLFLLLGLVAVLPARRPTDGRLSASSIKRGR